MEHEVSLTRSEELATSLYPEPGESSPSFPIIFVLN
jgi:hypothetical protein